jgi:hypothetical protein
MTVRVMWTSVALVLAKLVKIWKTDIVVLAPLVTLVITVKVV